MERHLATNTPLTDAEPAPGPLYPDRCLECPELWGETYGSVKPLKCVQCVAVSMRQKKRTVATALEDTGH